MTNKEQTISNLKKLKSFHNGSYGVDIDRAIKALEQEPKIIETIDFAINASDGDTDYFVGLRNGMRYVKSLIDGKEPQYESCAEQEPKTGHWIKSLDRYGNNHFTCPFCEHDIATKADTLGDNYCSNCGAKLQESEG